MMSRHGVRRLLEVGGTLDDGRDMVARKVSCLLAGHAPESKVNPPETIYRPKKMCSIMREEYQPNQ
mgnify:FL=1